MKKEGEIVTLNIAHREKDFVTLDEDGMDTLRLLLSVGRKSHSAWLKKHSLQKTKTLDEWSKMLKFRDKYIQKLFMSAKKVIIEVDWDKWFEIEKQLESENRRLGK